MAMFLCSNQYGFSLIALSFTLVCNLGISVSAPPTVSLALSDFKENSGMATAFINTIRLFGSSLLSMITGYFLTQYLEVLPLGLIGCGVCALYCSKLFKQQISHSEPEFDAIQAST
jgi:DHA1 family bicyclomycin/chloramphenicol resistance-like MFS transporter